MSSPVRRYIEQDLLPTPKVRRTFRETVWNYTPATLCLLSLSWLAYVVVTSL